MRIHNKVIKALYTSHSSDFNQLLIYDISIILKSNLMAHVWTDECAGSRRGKAFPSLNLLGKDEELGGVFVI